MKRSVPRDGRMFRADDSILDEAVLADEQYERDVLREARENGAVESDMFRSIREITQLSEIQALFAQLASQNTRQAGWTEPFTKFVAQISSDHAYVHEGLAYTAIITPGSITGSYKVGFTTPDKTQTNLVIHWRPIGISSSANYVGFRLYEDNEYTLGSDVVPINRDRVGVRTTIMPDFKTGVTATLTGTLLQAGGVGTEGSPQARAGGGAAADQELVLRPDTSYVMDFVPAGATTVVLELFWYEELYV